MGKWKSEAEAHEEIKNLVAEYYHSFKEQKKEYTRYEQDVRLRLRHL